MSALLSAMSRSSEDVSSPLHVRRALLNDASLGWVQWLVFFQFTTGLSLFASAVEHVQMQRSWARGR